MVESHPFFRSLHLWRHKISDTIGVLYPPCLNFKVCFKMAAEGFFLLECVTAFIRRLLD